MVKGYRFITIASLVLATASLVLVVVLSTIGADLEVIEVSLGVFLFWAVAWAVFQAVGWVKLPMKWILLTGVGFLAAGAIALVVHYTAKLDGLLLIGYTLAYVGAGWLVEALRRNRALSGKRGWLVGAIGFGALAVAVIGVWQFHGRGIAGFLWLGGIALLVILPVGINVLTEDALDVAQAHGVRARLFIIAGAAAPLVGLVIAAGVAAHNWTTMLIAVVAAVVVFAAIASNSHLDIAIVIAALALLTAAPPEVTAPARVAPAGGNSSLLALGDSYMSGEGADRFYAGTDDGGVNECRRAPSAYSVLASAPGGPFDDTTLLACSGARTANVISAQDDPRASEQWNEGATQVDQIAALQAAHPGWQPKLVIISIGGNDSGFATLGETCLAPGDCTEKRAVFEDNLPRVRDALDATYASLRKQLPDVPIVAVPYPQPVADVDSCDGLPLTTSERAFVTEFTDELDDTIRAAAAAAGLYYLDTMKQALADQHLQLCDPEATDGPGINQVSLNSVSGLSAQRYNPGKWLHDSLHPNEKGHAAMRDALLSWYASHSPLSAQPAPATTQSAVTTPTSAPAPPCEMGGGGPANCQTETRRWVVGQTLALWPWGVGALFAIVAAWIVAVTVISFLPRPWAGSTAD